MTAARTIHGDEGDVVEKLTTTPKKGGLWVTL